MEKIRKGALPGVIGYLAYSSYKGRHVIKARPMVKIKATPAQISQRNQLRVVNSFMKSIKNVNSRKNDEAHVLLHNENGNSLIQD